MYRRTFFAVAISLTFAGCSYLEDLDLSDIDPNIERPDIEDIVEDEVTSALELGVSGLMPASDYSETGRIDLGMVARNGTYTEANADDVKVEVLNRDGSYSACDREGGEHHEAAAMNVLTLLIDGSGSMERTYDPSDCATCPHDPGRERVGAAHRFIDTLYDVSRDSQLAVAEFGPSATHNFRATALHADFYDDRSRLWTALDSIGGYEALGTPLYDSMTEMLDETAYVADDVEAEEGKVPGRFLIVLSDGRDNESEWYGLWDSIEAAQDQGVVVYAVGLGPASAGAGYGDEQTNTVQDLQTLARETGGFYSSVDDPQRLHQLFDNVAYALGGGYERVTYRCVPRDNADVPADEASLPPSGTRVEGRTVAGAETTQWAFIAP